MNLFDIPEQLPEQELTEILLTGKTRIERIVSNGQTSGWYDQSEDEWVCVLQGVGELTYADGNKQRLHEGDSVYLPAHCRHRVSLRASRVFGCACSVRRNSACAAALCRSLSRRQSHKNAGFAALCTVLQTR